MTPPIEGLEIKTESDAISLLTNATEGERTLLLQALTKKSDSPEKEKLLQLEENNYRIDPELSIEEKIANGWKRDMAYLDHHEGVSLLKKEIPGKQSEAFVWEFAADVPEEFIGKQLFNRYAVLNLGLENKLPSYEDLEQLQSRDHEKFLKENNVLFLGYRHSGRFHLHDVGSVCHMWLMDRNLSDNNYVEIDNKKMTGRRGDLERLPEFGMPIRLLKI